MLTTQNLFSFRHHEFDPFYLFHPQQPYFPHGNRHTVACVCEFVSFCCISHMWVGIIDTMEYYSAVKYDEILPFVTTWMGLDSIMLVKLVRWERTRTTWFYLYVGYKTESQDWNLQLKIINKFGCSDTDIHVFNQQYTWSGALNWASGM